MTSSAAELFTTLPLADAERLDRACDAFEAAWRQSASDCPRLDDFLLPLPAELQSAALLEQLPIELAYLQRRGTPISADDYRRRYPASAPYLQHWIDDHGAPPPLARQFAPGEQFGRYTIAARLGAGGMGDVYRAVDPVLGREVAIKILLRRFQWSSEALARIKLEARALAALNHPHIVTVHDFATHDGMAYLALELLAGETLANRLRRGPLASTEALRLATQLAQALAVAHNKQIVHRDLKPQNIFLLTGGEPKILDFGLARLAQAPSEPSAASSVEPGGSKETAAGTRLGTTGYMSPEQIRGEATDVRSDVFAFGCVLYEMLFAASPFHRATAPETDEAILHEPPRQPATLRHSLSKSLFAVCRRCLQKLPTDRFASAAELAAELQSIEHRHSRRKGLLSRRSERLLLAIVCIVLVAVSTWLWHRSQLTAQFNDLAHQVNQLPLDQLDGVKERVREMNRLGDRLGMDFDYKSLLLQGAIKTDERYHCILGYLRLELGTKVDIQQAINHFDQALQFHPKYVPALVGLGECHYALSNACASPLVEMELVRDYAQQAAELGDSSGTAEVLLGVYEQRFCWDWNEAERHFQAALGAQPNSATALHMYGNALVLRKEFASGIPRLEDALELDPKSLELRTDLALAHLYADQYKPAKQKLDSVLASDPKFFPARWALGEFYLRLQDYPAAIRELRLRTRP